MKHSVPRFLLRTVSLLVCLAVLFKAADFLICDDVHEFSRAMLQDLYRSEENIDVLFLGPSHCYRSFDPAVVREELGIRAFNAGSSQQLYDGSYYMLQEAAKTNELKLVFLEVSNGGTVRSELVPEACYLLTDYMKPSAERREFLQEMGGVAALLESLTPARHNTVSPSTMVEAWKAKLTDGYTPGNYRFLQNSEERYTGDGFVHVNNCIHPGDWLATAGNSDPVQPISDFSLKYLQKSIAFCKEHNIELILVQAPMTDQFLATDEYRQAYLDYFSALAAENGIAYWDMSLCTGEYLQMGWEDFSDAHHLSGAGAEKTTRALCRMLAETQPGHRAENDFFFATLAEKQQKNPDATLRGAA